MGEPTQDNDLLVAFVEEAGQSLDTLNEKLLLIESGSRDEDSVAEMFRAAHSMKGAAGYFGLDAISGVTHSLETVLDLVRKDKLDFTPEVVEALFESFDTISSLLSEITTGRSDDIDITTVVENLERVMPTGDGRQETVPAAAADAESSVSKMPEDDVGWFPEFVRGKIDIDFVLDALIERNMGNEVYVLKISLQDVFDRGMTLPETIEIVKQAATVQRTIAVPSALNAVDQAYEKYTFDVALLITAAPSAVDKLAQLSLPPLILWHINREATESEPQKIGGEYANKAEGEEALLEIREDMQKHTSMWLLETSEELEQVEQVLLDFESNPTVSEHLNTLFRLMHRIKGSAASMGLSEMSRIAHNCESVLERFRASSSVPSEQMFQAIFLVKDYLVECLDKIKLGDTVAPSAAACEEALLAIINAIPAEGDVVKESWSVPADVLDRVAGDVKVNQRAWKIWVEVEPDTPMPDLRYLMILRDLKTVADIHYTSTSEKDLQKGVEGVSSLRILVTSSLIADEIVSMVQGDNVGCCEVEEVIIEHKKEEPKSKEAQVAKSSGVADTVRVETSRLDHLMNVTGELIITKAQITQHSDFIGRELATININSLQTVISFVQHHMEADGLKKTGIITPDQLRRLELNLKSLARAQNHSASLADTVLELHRHTGSLQNVVMQARMVPIGPLFQKFNRLVRDISKQQGQKTRLILRGETTELDKKLIDELNDPLTHLIRNSVDHGLESREERLAAGKDEEGSVTLEAFHEGGQICIRISDDGRGLAVEKIKTKALKNGLATEESFALLKEEEIFALIFQPGFSTAAKITDISGRGVGMDIVKTKINSLKGVIEIESQEGKGCSFTIRLPLTLAMIEGLLVKVGETRYAFPLETVGEIIEISPSDINTVEGKGKIVFLRDKAIPLVEMSDIIDADRLVSADTNIRAVITKTGSDAVAIGVDAILGSEEVVVKALSSEFKNVEGISGATVLGDGGIALVLDVPMVVEKSKNRKLEGEKV